MIPVVIYARFSSHNQREESIEQQLKECHAFAEKNGYTVIGEYIDKAISGTTDSRPDFLRMISDSSNKSFEYVIVYQLDRFARNRYDSAIYKAKLKKHGVRVLSARENITDDASGILVEGLLEAMAEYYSAELGQKIRRGMDYNAEQCLCTGGNVALGYKINSDKKYEIDAETAPIVEKIFEMYAGDNNITEICTYLNEQGYKTSRGVPFNKNSLRTILRNKRYIGVYTYKGEEIPDGIPRIISDDLFYKVQSIIDKNKKAPAHRKAKAEYILTTKLFCGKCRNMMTGIKGTGKSGNTYYYYKCNHAKKKLCDKKAVHKDYIENLVIEECRKLLTKENIDIIAKQIVELCEREKDNTNLKRLEKALRDIEKKQHNLIAAVAECGIESVRNSLYGELSKLNEEADNLNKQLVIEKSQTLSISENEIKFFLTQMKNGNVDDLMYRKTLINTFINRIYLYDDKLTIIFNTGDKPVEVDDKLLSDIESQSEFVFGADNSTNVVLNKLFFFNGGFAVTILL